MLMLWGVGTDATGTIIHERTRLTNKRKRCLPAAIKNTIDLGDWNASSRSCEVQDQGAGRFWCLVRAPFRVWGWPSSGDVLTWPFLGASTQRRKAGSLGSSLRALTPPGGAPPSLAPPSLSHLSLMSSQKCLTLGIRASAYEFWGCTKFSPGQACTLGPLGVYETSGKTSLAHEHHLEVLTCAKFPSKSVLPRDRLSGNDITFDPW